MPRLNESSSGLLQSFASLVHRHAGLIAVASIASAALALHYCLANLGINTDNGDLFSDRLPWRQTFLESERAFPQFDDNVLIVIDGDTPELADRAAAQLAARLETAGERFLWVDQPGGGPYFARNGLLYLDLPELESRVDDLIAMQPFLGSLASDPSLRGLFDLAARALEERDSIAPNKLQAVLAELARAIDEVLAGRFYEMSWRELMAAEPLGVRERRRIVLTQVNLDYGELLPAGTILSEIRAHARDLELDPAHGVRVRITGGLVVSHEEMASLSRGMVVTGVAALVMVGLVLAVGLGSLRLVAASLATLLVGLCWTGAFAAAAVGQLNLISIGFAVLYIGFGIDFSVHLAMRYRELTRLGGSACAAISGALRDIGGSLCLCALTTGLGFLAFVPTDFSAVSELGLISGAGMFISLLASLTVLPAMLAWRAPRAGAAPPSRAMDGAPLPAGDVDPRCPDWPARHRGMVLGGAALVAVLSVVSAFAVSFDRNPLNLRERESESVSTLWDLLAAADTSPWPAVVLVDGPLEAQALESKLAGLDVVDETRSLSAYVPGDQETKLLIIDELALALGVDDAGGKPPPAPPSLAARVSSMKGLREALEDAELARVDVGQGGQALRASLARLEARVQSAPDGVAEIVASLERALLRSVMQEIARIEQALDAGPVTVEDLPPLLVSRWVAADGRHRVEVFATEKGLDNAVLRRFVDEVSAVAAGATDTPVTMLRSADVAVGAFRQALLSALVIVAVVLLAWLRSARDTAIVLAPLLLGSGLTVSAMLVLGISFNFANIIALPLLLGAGVDNGVHMVHRARHAPLESRSLLRSSTTRAMVISALTTICSFGGLSLSAHPGTASMGQVLTLGIGFTLLSSLIVTPALLARPRVAHAAVAGRP